MRTAKIYSSSGTVEINFFTGEVLRILDKDPLTEAFDGLFKFNLHEWINYYNEHPREEYDILDLGFWRLIDGQRHYTQPDSNFREQNELPLKKEENNKTWTPY